MKVGNKNSRIFKFILFYAILAVLVSAFMPRTIDWSESYSKFSKNPYGSYILFEEIGKIFGDSDPIINDESLYLSFGYEEYTDHNLIIINQNFYPDSLDLNELYNFVNSGNNVFIAASDFQYSLLDSLGINTDWDSYNEGSKINFYNESLKRDSSYNIKKGNFNKYFKTYDSLNTITKISHLNGGDPNFVKVPYGSGHFYLHNTPQIFTNYYMMTDDIHDYISKALSHLPKWNLIWDEYYKVERQQRQATPMHIVLSKEPLKWAYWLIISVLGLFVFFFAKRRQRIIPIVKPYQNESVEFTKTISSMYFQNRNNADLTKKKINYFVEFVRSNYFIKSVKFGDEDATKLAYKTGHSKDDIQGLFQIINKVKNQTEISDGQLKILTKRLNKFYKPLNIK